MSHASDDVSIDGDIAVDREMPEVETVEAVAAAPGNRGALRTGLGWFRRGGEVASVFVLIIVVWQAIIWIWSPPNYILPAPLKVWAAMWNGDLQWGTGIWTTGVEMVGGFVAGSAAGFILGLLVAWSPLISRAVLPVLVVFNTLPKVAIAPLFIIYLGFGIFPNAVVAATIAFFPIVITTATGVMSIDGEFVDLARALRAPTWKVFLRIRLPNALPHVFSGLKVSCTMAVSGAVVGEFVASRAGLGNAIISTQVNLNTDIAFAALVWLSVLSLMLYGLVELIEWWTVPWARRRAVTE